MPTIMRNGEAVPLDADDPALAAAGVDPGWRTARIKAEAARRIAARYPLWRQQNMTARGVELQDVWRRDGQWTVEEAAEAAALQAAWTWIKAVRAHSGALEADPDAAIDDGWPP